MRYFSLRKRSLKIGKILKGEEGQVGLILVFVILSILGVVSLSFLYQMKLEQMSASNFQDALKANYLAQAGIERAIAELINDTNEYDDLYESWAKGFTESMGEGDYSVCFISGEEEKELTGIWDEAAKLNINVVGIGDHNEGWGPYELNMRALSSLSEYRIKDILKYRYGMDEAPGKKGVDDDGDRYILEKDGIDNDADGKIDEEGEGVDEPDEFSPDKPRGDDNPFDTIEEIRLVPGIGEGTFKKIKDFITIYSYDKNVDKKGKLRVNINKSSPGKISYALREAGVPSGKADQIAVNIVDFRDKDSCPTSYHGKYGIEKTPYINEVMPNFTSSVPVAVADLAEGGVRFLKDKMKEKIREKLKEKLKKDTSNITEKINEGISTKEEELNEEVEKIIKKRRGRELTNEKVSFLKIFRGKPAWASEGEPVKVDIEIEWIELFNPYDSSCEVMGWRIKTSLREKLIWGLIPARGYWLIFNVVIKMPGKTIGKELLNNFVDTVILKNRRGDIVDEATYYNYGAPWNAFEKNDPRVREFVSSLPGGSPGFRNWFWMPEIGEGKYSDDYSSFYVKDKPFANVGEVGFIHTGKQFRTVNLDRGGDWKVLDKLTVAWPVEKPVKGRINVNTASRQVLQSLPGIDKKLAESIIYYCDSKRGPIKEVGEIAEISGIQKLGFNGIDDDKDGYIDEDDEKEAILRGISNLITVRSNCFTIVSKGQVKRGGRVVAERKIKVVVDRGVHPVKIRYYKEICSK